MKIVKIFAFIIPMLGLGCQHKMCCTIIDINVDLKIVNNQGQNLLATPSTFDKNNIEVYYMVNGKPEPYYKPNLDASRGFIFLDNQSGIRLFLNHNKDEKRPVTLIKFGSTKTDTLAAEFKFNGSSITLQKVWHNGVLKDKGFTITK